MEKHFVKKIREHKNLWRAEVISSFAVEPNFEYWKWNIFIEY